MPLGTSVSRSVVSNAGWNAAPSRQRMGTSTYAASCSRTRWLPRRTAVTRISVAIVIAEF